MILNCAQQWQKHPDISVIKKLHSSSSTNYTMSTLDCAGGCVSCYHTTRLKAILASCLLCYSYRSWQSPERHYRMIFISFYWPVSCPRCFFFCICCSSHPLQCFFRALFAQLLQAPLFLCLLSLTADEVWYMYSVFTFFHPVIYAVRGFTLFGWPGFHVCVQSSILRCLHIPCLCSAWDCSW